MCSTSSTYLDGCSARHRYSFHLLSNSDASDVSRSPHEDCENAARSSYYCGGGGGNDSSVITARQAELESPRDSPAGRHPCPAHSSCDHPDWNLNSGHQAKRARVENIIRGMAGSPGVHCTNATMHEYERAESVLENKRNHKLEELPEECREGQRSGSATGKQPPLRQLRTRFYRSDDATAEGLKFTPWSNYPGDALSDSFEFENQKYQCWKKTKLLNYFQSKPERVKLMADVLKFELSRAVSMSVDSIFQSLQPQRKAPGSECHAACQSLEREDTKTGLSCRGNETLQVPDVQTEALSLVVQKQKSETSDSPINQRMPNPQETTFSQNSALHDILPSEKNLNVAPPQNPGFQAKCPMFDAHWTSVKVRSKVNARRAKSRTVSVDPVLYGNLCFPRVKIESDNLKKSLYTFNEGLTTVHLKKAKLMFFYTRYPSSLVLKMCFRDVQFTRCITSQLIKWFSNFREFFYIQIEKFARHALMEGAADDADLTVGRESQLFRALNVHYNKANDFQVPDRFLEVTQITLREFYVALSLGKDHDPSWKKSIYKVICKLDGDVPTEFQSQDCR